MARCEISWNTRGEDGVKRELNVRKVGNQWLFFTREKRYDCWVPVDDPPLDAWLELLDGVQRRIARRLLKPEEESRVKKIILTRYPAAAF